MSKSSSEEFQTAVPWALPGEEAAREEPEAPPEAMEAPPQPALPTAEDIEAIRREAYQKAFERGFREGRAKGEAIVKELKEKVTTQSLLLERIVESLAKPLEGLDEEVERELVLLATAIAQQLVRREIRTDPGQILAVVKEALLVLPVASQEVRVCLHPEDAALVQEALPQADRLWRIQEDPTLSRGGCRVLTETSQVDATVEKRLGSVIAEVLGTRGQDFP